MSPTAHLPAPTTPTTSEEDTTLPQCYFTNRNSHAMTATEMRSLFVKRAWRFRRDSHDEITDEKISEMRSMLVYRPLGIVAQRFFPFLPLGHAVAAVLHQTRKHEPRA